MFSRLPAGASVVAGSTVRVIVGFRVPLVTLELLQCTNLTFSVISQQMKRYP